MDRSLSKTQILVGKMDDMTRSSEGEVGAQMTHCQEVNEHEDDDKEKAVGCSCRISATCCGRVSTLDRGQMDCFFVQDTNSRSQDGLGAQMSVAKK